MVLPSSPAAAPSRRWSTGNLQFQQQQEQQQQQRKERSNFLTGLGRHVKWLGSTAATATGTIAVLATRQVGYLVNGARSSPGAATAAAMVNGSGGNGFFRQQQQQPGGALLQRTLMGQRSRSAPSLAVVAAGGGAAPVAAAGAAAAVPQAGLPSPAAPAAAGVIAPGDVLDDAIFNGSSSVTCSSISGRPSGVGRQVLNLPAPRISWGRRASHSFIVGQ
jgi:hypothetical protein